MFLSTGQNFYCTHNGKVTTIEECKIPLCTKRHKLCCTWDNPLFNYEGKCVREGYLGNTEVKKFFNSLTFHPIRNISKEEAFTVLLKPLLESYGPEELTEYLSSGHFLSHLKTFYPYPTEYSLAFGI